MAGGRGAARAADRNPHLGGPVTGGAVRAGRDPRAAGAAPEPGGRVPEPGGRGRSRGARGPWHRTRHHRQHREGGRPMTTAALTPTPATAAHVTLPSAAALALARTRLELRQFFRERDAVIFIFAYPIIMLAIFATVFADQEIDFGPGGTLDFATYFLPGMIATGVLLSSFQNLAIGIAEERDADGQVLEARQEHAGGDHPGQEVGGEVERPTGAEVDLLVGEDRGEDRQHDDRVGEDEDHGVALAEELPELQPGAGQGERNGGRQRDAGGRRRRRGQGGGGHRTASFAMLSVVSGAVPRSSSPARSTSPTRLRYTSSRLGRSTCSPGISAGANRAASDWTTELGVAVCCSCSSPSSSHRTTACRAARSPRAAGASRATTRPSRTTAHPVSYTH